MDKQPNLFDPDELAAAMARGELEAASCEEAAERRGWDSKAAGEFILDYLRKHGPTAGEVLVTEASKKYPPHDGRAFGPVFMRLSRAKLIETCGTALRVKGHGTSGGRIWRAKSPSGSSGPGETCVPKAA